MKIYEQRIYSAHSGKVTLNGTELSNEQQRNHVFAASLCPAYPSYGAS